MFQTSSNRLLITGKRHGAGRHWPCSMCFAAHTMVVTATWTVPIFAAENQVLLTSGTLVGDSGRTYQTFMKAQLSDNGAVLVHSYLSGDTTGDNALTYLANGNATIITREGTPAPGVPQTSGPILMGGFWDFALSNDGRIAYGARVTGNTITSANQDGIWTGDTNGTYAYVREPGLIPGTTYHASWVNTAPPFVHFNSANQLFFGSAVSNDPSGPSQGQVMWRQSPGASPVALAQAGQTVIGLPGATLGKLYDDEFSANPAFNDIGQASFIADIANYANVNRAIILASENGRYAVAWDRMAVPGLSNVNIVTVNVSHPRLNNLGQIAFTSALYGSGVTDANDSALFLATSSSLKMVARGGDAAPGTAPGTLLNGPGAMHLNDRGQVVFSSYLLGGDATGSFERGWFMGTPGDIRLIARTGGQAAGTQPGVTWAPSNFSFNHAGQYLMTATLAGTDVDGSNNAALYLGDAYEQVLVARSGDMLNGRKITGILPSGSSGVANINELGQVLYVASFADGTQSLVLHTPDIRWRSNTSGNWDDWRNWTAGIDPNRIHDVTIAGTASLTVTGPSSNRTIDRLTLGNSQGLTVLALANGSVLSATGGTTIHSNGTLTGDGYLASVVTNYGTVLASPGKLLGAEVLNNDGLVSGNGKLQTVLNNGPDGVVSVTAGSTLHFTKNFSGPVHSNLGLIEVNSGSLRMDNPLVNDSEGLILAADADLHFSGNLSNLANMVFSRGASLLHGDIDNLNGARVTLTGRSHVTFLDDVHNNGTIHLTTGSVAVFVGSYSGAGNFTGQGEVFIEGDMRPGNSPARTTIEGHLTFGQDSYLQMELGGLLPAVQHDVLDVFGVLTFDGTLEVSLIDGFVPSPGNTFDLFDWGRHLGAFDQIVLPDLPTGMNWDVKNLYVNGSIAVVPEPGYAGAFLATGLLLTRRRR